jgi:hypothetical protein
MSVNILTATNAGKNRSTDISMRRLVNTVNRRNYVFFVVDSKQTHGTIGRLLPSNETVNMHS